MRRPPTGSYVAAIGLLYGPMRFALDFLRIRDAPGADPRYLGLTAGHYGALAVTLLGALFLRRLLRSAKGAASPANVEPNTPS